MIDIIVLIVCRSLLVIDQRQGIVGLEGGSKKGFVDSCYKGNGREEGISPSPAPDDKA